MRYFDGLLGAMRRSLFDKNFIKPIALLLSVAMIMVTTLGAVTLADKSGVHMLYDEDDDPNTITITTNFFGAVLMADSKMAVSELIKKGIDDRNKQNSTECGLCGWCSKPLGICVYIWIVILVALAGAGYVVYKKLKGNNRKD